MPPIVFADAAALVIDYLKSAMPTMTVAHDVPNPRPDVFVRVYRTGGPRATIVTDAAQVSIESWAPDADTAMTNAQTARGHINDLPGRVVDGITFYRVDEFSGPAELPDPVSTSRRVTWTASVHLRST